MPWLELIENLIHEKEYILGHVAGDASVPSLSQDREGTSEDTSHSCPEAWVFS